MLEQRTAAERNGTERNGTARTPPSSSYLGDHRSSDFCLFEARPGQTAISGGMEGRGEREGYAVCSHSSGGDIPALYNNKSYLLRLRWILCNNSSNDPRLSKFRSSIHLQYSRSDGFDDSAEALAGGSGGADW